MIFEVLLKTVYHKTVELKHSVPKRTKRKTSIYKRSKLNLRKLFERQMDAYLAMEKVFKDKEKNY